MFKYIFARLPLSVKKRLVAQAIQCERPSFNAYYTGITPQSFPGYRHINLVPDGQLTQRVAVDAIDSNGLARLLLRIWFENDEPLVQFVRESLESRGYEVSYPDFDAETISWRPLKPQDLKIAEGKTFYSPGGEDLEGVDPVLSTLAALLLGWFDDTNSNEAIEKERVQETMNVNTNEKKDSGHSGEFSSFEEYDFFPGWKQYIPEIVNRDHTPSRQLSDIFDCMINLIELVCHVFSVCAIRACEDAFVGDVRTSSKRARPIKDLIRERFTAPTLGTLLELVRNCTHLVEDRAPNDLRVMKRCLVEYVILGDLGSLLEDLDKLFSKIEEPDQRSRKPVKVNRAQSKLSVTELFNELLAMRNKSVHITSMQKLIEDTHNELKFEVETWRKGLLRFLDCIKPLFPSMWVRKELLSVEKDSQRYLEKKDVNFVMDVTTYKGSSIQKSTETITFEEWNARPKDISNHVCISNKDRILYFDINPFLIIRDDKLYYYKKTTSSGYTYYSVTENRTYLASTKKKFSRSLFVAPGMGSQQALFWTQVPPFFNKSKSIKANIPFEAGVPFIGRKRQLRKIKEEIIDIPNQNGIVFGLGGVGKTALILKLTEELFENDEDRSFENIIWVSAKRNYYDPTFNLVEEKNQQFNSLDNILCDILHFFEYEEVEEYPLEDKTELVLGLFEQNRVLLVLDNVETLTQRDAEQIVRFFQIDVKRRLRSSPSNFKVIITSRELIPSGFQQMKLEGLDLNDSRQLMKALYNQYKGANVELTDEQRDRIHDATSGIPIVIKHCFAQLYEYNRTFDEVVKALESASNEVIKFSFAEILDLVVQDRCSLKILILLEKRAPLSTRQISEILEVEEFDIKGRLPVLINYQCVEKQGIGEEERYRPNDQVHLLTKSLVRDHADVAREVQQLLLKNLTIQKRMDYSKEEETILSLFLDYLERGELLEAEHFVVAELKNRPKSFLLRLHYARYLEERKGDPDAAIEVLNTLYEETKQAYGGDPNVLLSLISCYQRLDVPNYEQINVYVNELNQVAPHEDIVKLKSAEFLIDWSTVVKMKQTPDPIKDLEKRVRYKDLANKGLSYLFALKNKEETHHILYLKAQAYFNLMQNDKALQLADRSIELAQNDPTHKMVYEKLRRAIVKKVR
jgi:hypothetical protein